MTLTYFKVHIPEEVGQCKMGSLRKKETAFVIMISIKQAASYGTAWKLKFQGKS